MTNELNVSNCREFRAWQMEHGGTKNGVMFGERNDFGRLTMMKNEDVK